MYVCARCVWAQPIPILPAGMSEWVFVLTTIKWTEQIGMLFCFHLPSFMTFNIAFSITQRPARTNITIQAIRFSNLFVRLCLRPDANCLRCIIVSRLHGFGILLHEHLTYSNIVCVTQMLS